MWVFNTKSLVFPQWEKKNRFFFSPCLLQCRPFTWLKPVTVAPQSLLQIGWKHSPCFLTSHQSEWGRQLNNPLCNSFSVCDGRREGGREGVDKTRIGQMPFMLPTQSSAESSSHASALRCLLQTTQRLKLILQNCPHPHESLDKGAAGFGLCYLVWTLCWYEPWDLFCSDS